MLSISEDLRAAVNLLFEPAVAAQSWHRLASTLSHDAGMSDEDAAELLMACWADAARRAQEIYPSKLPPPGSPPYTGRQN